MENYPIKDVDIVKLIKVSFLTGKGTSEDLFRIVTRYYDLDGNLLFTIDPVSHS